MLLMAVDIGNTNVVIGFIDDGRIAGTYRITTKANHTSDEYGLMITQFLALSGYKPADVDDVIISSVVPKVMHSFRASIVKFLDIDPMIVGPGIKTGLNIRMDNPQNMGADCIADCAGAYYEYGGPILVADFGTATTFNYVTADASVISGLITTPPRPHCGKGRRSCRKWRSPVRSRFWRSPRNRPCRRACTTTSSAASNARSRSSIRRSTRISVWWRRAD